MTGFCDIYDEVLERTCMEHLLVYADDLYILSAKHK